MADCRQPFVVSVEGNIGSGKSTFINYLSSSQEIEPVLEPIDKWTSFKRHNPLDLLYSCASRWTFSFNSFATLTRLEMHDQKTEKPVKMLERSLYSTRYCFIENALQMGELHEMEYHVLCSWFDFLVENHHLNVDLFVYLRTDPEVCFQRLQNRHRKEESTVPFSLIKDLHNHHEKWLVEEKHPLPAPVMIIDGNTDMPNIINLYENCRSEICTLF